MTIKQHIFNKDGIANINDNTQLLSLFAKESANINNCIAEHNLANDSILVFLNTIATASSALSDIISNTYNMLMDSVVLNNAGQTLFSLFDGVNVVGNGITIDKLTNTIYLNKKIKYQAQIADITYSTNGDIGNSVARPYVTRANIKSITSSNAVEFEKFDTSMQLSIHIKFAESTPLNGVKLTLSNISSVLPSITKITYTNKSNDLFELNYVGDITSQDAVSNSEYGNIFLQTEQVNATGLIIQFEQNYPDIVNGQDRYTIGISDFEAGYYESVSSGYAVFGPYNSTSPIIKIAYSADIIDKSNSQNTELSFSHNNVAWIPLINTDKISSGKILNVNNISTDAVFFDNQVKQFWIRLNVESYDASQNINTHRRSLVDSNQWGQSILLDDRHTFTSAYENLGFSYGATNNVSEITETNLFEFAKSKNGYFGLSEDNDTYNTYHRYASPIVEQSSNVSVYSKEDMIIETARLLKLTTPSELSVRLNGVDVLDLRRKYVIKVKADMSNGLYQLHIDGKIKYIDVSLGFVMSTMATLFVTEEDLVSLVGPDGYIYQIEPITIAGTKYISLIGVLFEQQDAKHNIYPHITKSNSFYIERGGIIAKNIFDTVTISGMNISESIADVGSYADRHVLITQDIKKSIGSTNMGKYTFKKTAKLKHCNIIAGTVKMDFSNAFIHSLIKEVKFIDGEQEFVSSKRITQFNNTNLNEIVLAGVFVDDNTISFYGGSSLFKNRVYSTEDLVELGDWLLILDGGSYKIKLPSGVKTSATIDTAIEYNVDNQAVNKDGIYSIDYQNGTMFASSPIDGNIVVNYQYYNMALEGQAAIELNSNEYIARDGILTISKQTTNPLSIVYKEGKDDGATFIDSPILSNISINTITELYIKWLVKQT